jgi:dTDP-4-dehydrorhamnose reductase
MVPASSPTGASAGTKSGADVGRSVLIAGAGGMLGTALRQVLGDRGSTFMAPPEAEFDITDAAAVARVVRSFASGNSGGLLINAAAYTNVERAEDEADTAFRVNERGARVLAEAAQGAGLGFVHVSTDFVFDGAKHGGYVESDAVNPLSVYGVSKLAGELAVAHAYPDALIVRTAWVFGPGGENFPAKILSAARSNQSLRVVTDECGSPTYTIYLAAGILDLVDAGGGGLFHLAGRGSCTRFELAVETLRLAGVYAAIEPVSAASFPSRVQRPANSVLDCSKAAAMGVVMPEWQDGLARFVPEDEAL